MYQPIQISRKFDFATLDKNNQIQSLKKKKSVQVYTYNQTRFFKIISGSSPIASLNNKAVENGLQRNYNEAKILFEQIINEDPDIAAVNNNLGLIYEFLGNKERALDLYNRACVLEPDNEYFKDNFLNCED